MEIHWSGATRYHNWMEHSVATPAKMIGQFAEAGLIGHLDWIKLGMQGKKETIISGNASLLGYLSFKPKKNDLYSISGGGTFPFKWKFTLGLFPFKTETGRVQGYNIISLWLEKTDMLTLEGSELLFNTFKKVHCMDNTEFAFIHPFKNWSDLNNPFLGAYKIPVTFNPMFTGVYWGTFLGRGQLELFDTGKIKAIKTNKINRERAEELFIRMTPNIADVLDQNIQNEMIKLTEQFRAALI